LHWPLEFQKEVKYLWVSKKTCEWTTQFCIK